jgi:hypothetical protein
LNENSRQIETPSTLQKAQTLAMFEPLVACISRLGGNIPGLQVPYKAVKHGMNRQKQEIANLGWSSFGMLMDAAYKAKLVEPIHKKPGGKLEFLRLSPLVQVKPAECLLQDRPITPTISGSLARKSLLPVSSPICPLNPITPPSSQIPLQPISITVGYT